MKNRLIKCRVVFFIGLIFVLANPVFSNNFIKVFYIQNNKNQFDFYASNLALCPVQVLVRVRLCTNAAIDLQPSTNLPFYTILEPGEYGSYLFSIKIPASLTNVLKYGFESYMGDPGAVSNNEDYLYMLPYQEGEQYKINQGYKTRFSHRGWTKYSIDFGMNSGTPVCAARDGLVVDVKTNSSRGGMSRRYSQYANFITIFHDDGTFSQYVHLVRNGSMVNIGDRVKAGQIIGFSGNTGRTNGPHLHFMVYKPIYLGRDSIPTKFLGPGGEGLDLIQKKYYVSYHTIENTNTASYGTIIAKDPGATNTLETNVGGP